MYCKIRTTYELYRADQESSTLFISNTLKHISRVFVLAKSLYLQAQTLQQLNEAQPDRMVVACTAVWAGEVRLIDNLILQTGS